jgi:hypothetical protein
MRRQIRGFVMLGEMMHMRQRKGEECSVFYLICERSYEILKWRCILDNGVDEEGA